MPSGASGEVTWTVSRSGCFRGRSSHLSGRKPKMLMCYKLTYCGLSRRSPSLACTVAQAVAPNFGKPGHCAITWLSLLRRRDKNRITASRAQLYLVKELGNVAEFLLAEVSRVDASHLPSKVNEVRRVGAGRKG